jgi:hypothetical protein
MIPALLGLPFDPEEGGSIFIPKADKLLPDYPTPNPKDNSDYHHPVFKI